MAASSNGKGKLAFVRERYEYYMRKAQSFAVVLEEMGEDAMESSQRRATATLRGALALDDERRGVQGRKHVVGVDKKERHAAVRQLITEKGVVSSRDVAEALNISQSRAGQILIKEMVNEVERFGHMTASRYRLRAQREKPAKKKWDAKARAKEGYFTRKVEIARRKKTAQLLAHFDMKTPRPARGSAGMASLLRFGFLVKQGDGYVRTDKTFYVDPEDQKKHARAEAND